MSLRQSERPARYAVMFPPKAFVISFASLPSADEQRVFDEYGLSLDARRVAIYSARQHADRAAAIYRMIAATRGPWIADGA